MEKRTRKLERQTREAYLFLFRELFSRGTRTGRRGCLKLMPFRLSTHYATRASRPDPLLHVTAGQRLQSIKSASSNGTSKNPSSGSDLLAGMQAAENENRERMRMVDVEAEENEME
jgi:hypothetical protein